MTSLFDKFSSRTLGIHHSVLAQKLTGGGAFVVSASSDLISFMWHVIIEARQQTAEKTPAAIKSWSNNVDAAQEECHPIHLGTSFLRH